MHDEGKNFFSDLCGVHPPGLEEAVKSFFCSSAEVSKPYRLLNLHVSSDECS